MRFLFLIFSLLITAPSFSQDQNSTQDTSGANWVSISNDYIKVSVDPITGRYIVYDRVNYHPPATVPAVIPPSELEKSSDINDEDKLLSPILGKPIDNYNIAVFEIDGNYVIFGSDEGKWKGMPIIQNEEIIYNWQIGSLNIAQTLSIVTNKDTAFPDAVRISYDVQNTNTQNSIRVGAKIIIDPNAGDGREIPFFLPGFRKLQTEFAARRGSIPEYWIQSDQNGNISPLSVKGYLTGTGLLRPDRFFLTTLNKALKHLKEEHRSSRSTRLDNADNGVVLEYYPKEVRPQSSLQIAVTEVSIPSLMNNFQNNGLEAVTSAFNSQDYTPVSVGLWISNTSVQQFDNVRLTLIAPPEIEVYDSFTKELYDVGNIDGAYPVNWNIGSKDPNGGDFDATVSIQGFVNGNLTSQFTVPLTISIAPNFSQNNQANLEDTRSNALTNLIQAKKVPTTKTNTVKLSPYSPEDTHGAAIQNLSDLEQYLNALDPDKYQQVIQMINSELQIMQDLQQTEISVSQINEQIQVLSEVYQRLYQNDQLTDREQINIQGLIDNIATMEQELTEQESIFTNLAQ